VFSELLEIMKWDFIEKLTSGAGHGAVSFG